MGEVYRATNVSLGRKVAIKLLNKEHTSNEDDVMRFLREARAAAAVRHPNVVDVFDVARDDDGTPFIVQELLSGQDLEQYLGASGGKVNQVEALEIMIPVADAVAAAHAHNVVHRDLKPANIFLAREGKRIIPKVLDFGACLYQTVGALSAKEQRMLIGTPHYMAPEQITTAMDVDARADVWAMGVILYELLVGETPFEADDANAVMKLVRTRQVLRLRKLVPAASESLEALIARCLDRDRRKRFADCSVVRDELEKIRASELASGSAVRKKLDTQPEFDDAPPRSGVPKKIEAKKIEVEPPSQRIPSLVLKGARPGTRRRGAALLTLSAPDSAPPEPDAPVSASRAVESIPRIGAKPARTAADVIREAEAAPPPPRALSARPPATPASAMSPAPISRPREQGAPRDLDFDEHSDPSIDLDLVPPSRQQGHSHAPTPTQSSIPPCLDPRAASSSSSTSGAGAVRNWSDRPPASLTSSLLTDGASAGAADRSARISRADLSHESSLTPPLAPSSQRTPRISSSSLQGVWSTKAKASFGAVVLLPALAAFVALRLAPSLTAPIGHAMRGDTPLASGVLAVLTLVGAAALATRALGSSRSSGTLVATIGSVVLGIVMIIVTFSASETAELGAPPAAGGIVPFIAPIIPLGLGLAAFGRARSVWVSRYDRAEAIRFAVLTSLMLVAMVELGPFGAVRAATAAASGAPSAPAATSTAGPRSPP
jgi:serine/threonine-protein kinase